LPHVKIYGGFSGTETTLAERQLVSWETSGRSILSGDIGILNDNTDNCYHVVISVGDVGVSCLDGFTIIGGNANGSSGSITVNGTNIPNRYGGGIYTNNSSPSFANISIYENVANYGGGMYNHASSPVLTNVSISGNTASSDGGGIRNYASSPVLTNVSIGGNMAGNDGSGIHNTNTSTPKIRNSIIWGNRNSSNAIDNIFNSSINDTVYYSYTLLENGNIGNGIISNSKPLFVDVANNDLQLYYCSPAIDIGNNDFFNSDSLPDISHVVIDLNNNQRINNATIDLGAFEHPQNQTLPSVVLLNDDTTICEGVSFDVEFAFNGNPNFTLVYTIDNGSTYDTIQSIGNTSYTWQVNPTNTTTYHFVSIGDMGCSFSMSDSITIHVIPTPVLTNTLSNQELCDGEQTTAINFTSTGTSTYFEWEALGSISELPTGIQTGNFGTYLLNNKTTHSFVSNITVTPKFINGNITCLGTPQQFSITVNSGTVIHNFKYDKTIFCENESFEMEVEATGGNLIYSWFHNGNLLAGQVNDLYSIPQINMSHSGSYYVEVQGACGDVKSQVVNIEIQNDNVLVEKWHDVILVDNSKNEYKAYQWYRNGSMIPSANNQFYQELGGLNGCYSVELTLVSGKKVFSCERCLSKVSKQMAIYPNPTMRGNPITVILTEENQTSEDLFNVALYTMDGKLLKMQQQSYGRANIETSSLPAGVYILKITTKDGRSFNEKIVVY